MGVDRIRLRDDLSILQPYPAALLGDSLLVADLHLGMEEDLEIQGIHVPRNVSAEVRRLVLEALELSGAEELVILGDLKHEFGAGLHAEYREVEELIKGAASLRARVKLVRGNHDNYIAPVVSRLGGSVIQDVLRVGDCCLTHGHLDLRPEDLGCGCLAMGHEHPTVTLRDEVGVKHRFKAFLWGRAGMDVLVLPSPNPLAQGMPVNEVEPQDLLSPILRRFDVDSFEVYAVEPRGLVVRLATVGALRALLHASRRIWSWPPSRWRGARSTPGARRAPSRTR